MPSPFPGMDPYLEGQLWPDVHHRLATQIGNQSLPTCPVAISPAALWLPVSTRALRLASVEIREANNDRLVTTIAILSPANKREPGLENYRAKRDRLIVDGVHLLEIDLPRRGTRPETDPLAPVPLLSPDPDVPLDLQAALTAIYDEAAYDLSIDYVQEPPPPLRPEDQQWLRALIAATQEMAP